MNSVKESCKKIENEPIFQEFYLNRQLEESTIRIYKYALQKYSNFTNRTLTDLLEEAEEEEESNIRFRKRKINSYLTNFKAHLDKLDMAQSSRNQTIMLVRPFYNEFDIQLPRNSRRKSRKARILETIDDLPTMNEIKKFLEYCNNVYRAIILLGLSSGMSRAEISSLTFKHFYESISLEKYPKDIPELVEKLKRKGDFIPYWKIKRIKTGRHYFTFSSPESIDRIIIYLEDLNYKYPDYNPTPQDKLFRSLKSNNPLKAGDIGGMYCHINKKGGFRRINDHYIIRCHTLRKYFATTLEKNKVPHLTTRWLLGHSIDNTTSAYFKADPEALKEDYMDIVNQLTTDKVEIKVIDRYDEIKQEINTIKDDLGGLVISRGKVPEDVLDYIHQLEHELMTKESK